MPDKLSRYQILEEIGRGGFAVVYRAQDTELNRPVALKELRPTLLDDTDWIRRFKREAQTIALLNHPRIVTVYDVLESANRLFIVMRLVDGPSLEGLLKQKVSLSWSQALDIIITVGKALDYAHDRDILHRDLKPANILLDRERGPQLSDFGLAKLASEANSSVTAAGAIVGTPSYIAPEMWEGEGSSKQSDIYALGCILCEMLTGEKLFRGDSPPAVMMAHFSPPPLRDTWPQSVPLGIADVLRRALAKKPGDRFATAGELIAALNKLALSEEAEAAYVVEEMGRGVKPRQPAKSAIRAQMPPFIQEVPALEAEAVEAEPAVLVDREAELAQLDAFLDRALAGRGLVAFISGEAGQGKTSLLKEFVRRAQEVRPNLIVARGICDVYTGVGDPYLPFREVMSMLSGDVETQWAAGTISRDHVLRLWHLLPHVVQALLECGPNLIDTFVSGQALTHRAEAYAGNQPNWLAQLQAFTDGRPGAGHEQEPDQSHLFEEYTTVLTALTRRQPLLLILDDLHWADLSSVSLLGHLGQRVTDHPLLIVGAYRPEDVAQGREGQPHPLEDILSEFKRRFGDVWVSLNQAVSTRSRAFVDAYLDTEPNRLDESFRQELVRHTEGHPLFTAELLHDLQERGDLVQDEQSRWTVGPNLNWEAFPTRVEGVIERRIKRLEPELQQVLTVASVEGETFTAGVIAQVQGIDERSLVRRLSNELGRQHRLVQEQGIQRVGSRRLSRYRFRHNLFQHYLYQSLGEVERTYLHEDVGQALESLYGDQKEEIAAQLARHFASAGDEQRALSYFSLAGDAAAAIYADTEAAAHYRHALNIAQQAEAEGEQLLYLYNHLGRVLELSTQYEQALQNYKDMEALAQQRHDRPLELAALMARIPLLAIPTPLFDPELGRTLGEQALVLARELDDQAAEAKLLWILSIAYQTHNQNSKAIEYGERSLTLARSLNLREQMALTLTDLGLWCYSYSGRFDQAKEVFHEASLIWRELNNLPMLANNLASLGVVSVFAGDYDQAETYSQEALQISQASNNLWGQSYSRHFIGNIYWEQGQPERAIDVIEACIRFGDLAGFHDARTVTRADLAAVYGDLGAIERGLSTARLALTYIDPQDLCARPYVLGILAQLHLGRNNLTEAAGVIDEAVKSPGREALAVYFMPARIAEGELALKQGDYERALTIIEPLLAELHQFGMRSQIPKVLYLQAQALLGLDQAETARGQLEEAQTIAEATGSRWMLWQILAALGEIEGRRKNSTEAEALRRQAQEIVGYIADHTLTPELRTSFLNRLDVRAVLDG